MMRVDLVHGRQPAPSVDVHNSPRGARREVARRRGRSAFLSGGCWEFRSSGAKRSAREPSKQTGHTVRASAIPTLHARILKAEPGDPDRIRFDAVHAVAYDFAFNILPQA